MATYKEIQNYVKQNNGYIPKSCWIAHMKELCGLNPKMSARRYSPTTRTHPCPLEKQDDAFKHYRMVK
jgi:hypothetical protein